MPKVAAILLVAFSLLPAEPADSLLSQMTAAQDSTAQASADSLVPTTSEPQTSQADPRDSIAALQNDSEDDNGETGRPCGGSEGEASPDTSWKCETIDLSTGEISPSDSLLCPESGVSGRFVVRRETTLDTESVEPHLPSGPKKSVLYLSGGERSPWFHLGVLYAIETYKVRIDSVVGTSWGAFVGYLWTHG
ncbi:MAG: hypothetical protein IJ977_05910, partial [Fibrobacter sp.]|nr:hypothetical protein [Fibrobacter sp.]